MDFTRWVWIWMLSVYTEDSQRQDGGETPYGLVVMSALLVKLGLVGLSDLMAFVSYHVSPEFELTFSSFRPTTPK